MKKTAILIVVLICSNQLYSQNLIANPDFEIYDTCPVTFSKRSIKKIIPHWESPNLATPDYYHRCSKTGAGVPYNWAGIADAQSGDGYMGIFVYDRTSNYREHITTKLIRPLVKNHKYIFEFYYSLADYSLFAVDKFHVKVETSDSTYILDFTLHEADSSDSDWDLARDTILAIGGEFRFTFGNFPDRLNTRATHLQHRQGKEPIMTDKGYYYLDNIFLADIEDLKTPPQKIFTLEKPYTLQSVNFEFNEYKILSSGRMELDNLVAYLLKNEGLSISVYGHTDESGDEAYNMELSLNRAKTVAEFLIFSGVDPSRIDYKGYGESRPLQSNGEKNPVNRRVEFILRNN